MTRQQTYKSNKAPDNDDQLHFSLLFCFQSSSRLAENLERNIFHQYFIFFRLTASQLSDNWMDLMVYSLSSPNFFCWKLKRLSSIQLIVTVYVLNQTMNLVKDSAKAISWWSPEWRNWCPYSYIFYFAMKGKHPADSISLITLKMMRRKEFFC